MKVPVDSLIAALLHPHLYLSGDEDCGVSLNCRDHNDGGRPIAYYDGGLGPCPDETVVSVTTIPGLWIEAVRHLEAEHREA